MHAKVRRYEERAVDVDAAEIDIAARLELVGDTLADPAHGRLRPRPFGTSTSAGVASPSPSDRPPLTQPETRSTPGHWCGHADAEQPVTKGLVGATQLRALQLKRSNRRPAAGRHTSPAAARLCAAYGGPDL